MTVTNCPIPDGVAPGLVEMGRGFLPAQARKALVLAGHHEKDGCPFQKCIRAASFEPELDATTIAPPWFEPWLPGCRVLPGRVAGLPGCCRVFAGLPGLPGAGFAGSAAGCCRVLPGCRVAGLPVCR